MDLGSMRRAAWAWSVVGALVSVLVPFLSIAYRTGSCFSPRLTPPEELTCATEPVVGWGGAAVLTVAAVVFGAFALSRAVRLGRAVAVRRAALTGQALPRWPLDG